MQYQNTLLGQPIAKHTMYGRERYRKYADAVGFLRGQGFRKIFPIGEDDRKVDEKEPEKRPEQVAQCLRARDYANWNGNFVIPKIAGCLTGGSGVLSKEDEALCIDTGCTQGPMIGSRIRRLTQKECYRLQGFCPRLPDGTFDDTFYEKAKEVASQTQIYKTAGNAVTVNVISAIAERLK